MAQLLGPDPASRRIWDIPGYNRVGNYAGYATTIYLDQACTQLAAINTYDGTTTPAAAISGSRVALDGQSRLPQFWFPVGVDVLYAAVTFGPSGLRLDADYDTRLDVTIPDPGGLYAPQGRMPKFVAASSIVSQLQAGHGWLGSTGFTTNDTADFVVGSQSAKLATAGDGGTYKIEKTGLSLDTTGKMLRLRLKIDNLAYINTWKFLIGNDTGYSASYSWDLALAGDSTTAYFTDGDWVTITLSFASATTTGSPTRTGVVCMKLNTRDDNTGHAVTAHLQSVELLDEPSAFTNGLVSLSFDDNWDSVWLYAKPKLDAAGFRGSLFLIDDLVGQSGRLTAAQTLTMQDQGWEIAAHAHANTSHTATYTGLSSAQLETDLRGQVASLRAAGYRGTGSSSPQGSYGRTTDGVATTGLSRRYFSYSRTVFRRTVETFPPADPMRLRAQSAISTFGGGYAPSLLTTTTTGDLDRVKAAKGWLHLVFHKVVTGSPAATSEIAQTDFNAIIDKIVSNGMACLPIGDALTYYG